MALQTRSLGAAQGVQVWLTYDDTPLPLDDPTETLYTHRYELRRGRCNNQSPNAAAFRVKNWRTNEVDLFVVPGQTDATRNFPNNRYFMMDGPEGMDVPYELTYPYTPPA